MPNRSPIRSRVTCALLAASLLAGCGGEAAPPSAPATADAPTATASAEPALTAASDRAACADLQRTVEAVSLVVGHTTEGVTQALHPKALAEKLDTAQHSLLDSARVIEIVRAPAPLAGSQREFAKGLRMFAADFGRAKATTRRGNMSRATEQLTDEVALKKIQAAAKRIDDLCRG
jgi:hypothetical protein